MKPFTIVAVIVLTLLAAFSRLIPHPLNFTPIMAMAIFCGSVLHDRRLAYALPLFAMILSDALLGFHELSMLVYVAMLPGVWMGQYLKSLPEEEDSQVRFFGKWIGVAVLAELVFFVVTNVGVWWLSGIYERNLDGFLKCFALALPFFKNSISGTTTFLGLMLISWYGLMYLARIRGLVPQTYKSNRR